MAKARAVVTTKAKKKTWHPILAPKAQNNVVLGETYVAEPEAAVGRAVHANLRTITDNMRDQNVYLKFKITQLTDKKFYTDVTGYYMTPHFIKKMTRRNTLRIDDSFIIATKDGKKVRIKPIAVTRYNAVHSIGTALRKAIRNLVAREAAALSFTELITSLTSHQLQNTAKKRLAKTYPLRSFEIKVLELAREGKKAVKAKEEEKTEEAPKKEKKAKKKKLTVSEEMAEEFEKKEEVQKGDAKDSVSFGE